MTGVRGRSPTWSGDGKGVEGTGRFGTTGPPWRLVIGGGARGSGEVGSERTAGRGRGAAGRQ